MNELERKLPMKTADFVFLLSDIEGEMQENFIVFTLDGGRRLIRRHLVFKGSLTSVMCHPREIFAHALHDRAASVTVAHNHPSGDTAPSGADISTTQQLIAAGLIMGVEVSDHLIVSKSGFYSFRGMGLL